MLEASVQGIEVCLVVLLELAPLQLQAATHLAFVCLAFVLCLRRHF